MKTTEKQFNLFKDEFTEWQVKFELSHYRIDFYLKDIKGRADIRIDNYGKCAAVRLRRDWGNDDKITEFKLKDAAKHEAIHLLLSRFSDLAESRYIREDELISCEEELVRKIQELI